jgi:DNA primase
MNQLHRQSREVVADVLDANDIADVIGSVVTLKPAGTGRLKGLCPFHQEKTPSFHVSRDKQMYHCFGCGKGGDALDFLQEYEGLTFPEALQRLADRAGIRLAESGAGGGEPSLRGQLQEFNEFAARFYSMLLADPLRGGTGRRYLKTRDLREDTVARFGLGYAPDAWDTLRDAALTKGISEKLLDASGLTRRGEQGSLYDFFRNRLMFPIKDTSGRVVAFGGRALDDSPAKYINSPETQLYKKSRTLYALSDARDALRNEKLAILVEGYFDALRCFDAGIDNVVATCGTALTPEQAAVLRRHVPEVVIVYDGDSAGINAALKATALLVGAGLTVRAARLPGGQDPDDFIRAEGADAFRQRVLEATDFLSFYVESSRERTQTIEGRTAVAHELFDILQEIDDELRRDEYLKRVARELGLNEWACRNEYQRHLREQRQARPATPAPQDDAPVSYSKDDVDFIAVLLHSVPLRDKAADALKGLSLEASPFTLALRAALDGPHAARLESGPALALYTAAANVEAPKDELAEDVVVKRLKRLELILLRKKQQQVMRQLHEAEMGKDQARMVALLGEKMQIDRQLQEVGAA